MDTAPAPPPAIETEADRLLRRRQAVRACSQALWDRASALESGEDPAQDKYTEWAKAADRGEPGRARWHAEDYDEETAGVLDALLSHIEETGQIPTAWRKPLPGGATNAEVARYAASLAVPDGGHVITRQFTATARLHEGRWVIDPSCLPGDGLDLDGGSVHGDDCPCGLTGQAVTDALDQAGELPAPTPGWLADSIRHAYTVATAPPNS